MEKIKRSEKITNEEVHERVGFSYLRKISRKLFVVFRNMVLQEYGEDKMMRESD